MTERKQKPLLLVLADPTTRQLARLDNVGYEFDVVVSNRLEVLQKYVSKADAILVWIGYKELFKQLVPKATNLKWVHSIPIGVDGLLTPELVAREDVIVTNSRGVFARSLAEFVVAGMLYFAKQLRRMLRQQSEKRWGPFVVEELAGKTAAIIGYGSIGQATARRLKAFEMKVLAVRNRPELSAGDPFVDEVHFPHDRLDVIARADYVIVATPLTPETEGMIGERELAAMKSTAVLINVGRGPVVNENALIKFLKENRIRGAVLDVFTREPLPPDHPFWAMENVLISPHCADHTPTWLDEAMEFFVENFRRYIEGKELLNVVDKQRGY